MTHPTGGVWDAPEGCADLAEFQQGVLSRRQLLAAGVLPGRIRSRVRAGRWRRLQDGVYATFTGPPGRPAELWAAILRCGDGAVLSHQTAAELTGLASRASPVIHVTIPVSRTARPVPGLVLHRSGRIAVAAHPVLAPPRTRVEETVLDLVQDSARFSDAFDWLCRACGGRLTTPERLLSAMADRKKLRWRDQMSEALGEVGSGVHSGLEYRYVHDVEQSHGLPRAVRQARAGDRAHPLYRDHLYRGYGVVAETDGNAAHPVAGRWRDIRRDNAAAAQGMVTVRYGWREVIEEPCRTAAELARVLRARGWRGQLRRCGASCRLPHP